MAHFSFLKVATNICKVLSICIEVLLQTEMPLLCMKILNFEIMNIIWPSQYRKNGTFFSWNAISISWFQVISWKVAFLVGTTLKTEFLFRILTSRWIRREGLAPSATAAHVHSGGMTWAPSQRSPERRCRHEWVRWQPTVEPKTTYTTHQGCW